MRKSIIIGGIAIGTLSLSAFGIMNWKTEITNVKTEVCSQTNKKEVDLPRFGSANFELFYNVSNRFVVTVTKDQILTAKTIVDLVPENATTNIVSFRDVRIVVLKENEKSFEKGANKTLTTKQLSLLKEVDYSTNFCIEAFCSKKDAAGNLVEQCFVYYITVIPEMEAEYKEGKEALINYLKKNSKEYTGIIEKDKLKPGKVEFIVTKDGTIENVRLDATSGYNSIDKLLLEVVEKIPGEWEPASNSFGENVDQKMVFFFGLEGC